MRTGKDQEEGVITMTSINKKAIAAMIVAGLGAAAFAGPTMAASSSATATARIYQAMTIGAATTNIDFGILTPTAGGAVTVNGDNTLNVGAAATATAGTPSAATFAITGLNSSSYSISFAGSSANLTSGANTMAVTFTGYSFNTDNTYATSGTTATTSGTGTDTLRVGATITVGAAQAAGTYSGTANVTVDYN
jgi:hypothetical protein